MDELTVRDFTPFFQAIHGHPPFPWQVRLAELVCAGKWPGVIDLPTASGKTACLDIAVFAMALKQQGPRRVFFVVDRRVVVDGAAERMKLIADNLANATSGILKTAADRLRTMAQCDTPLDTYVMRGGIYRDDSWVRSPLQPALIASTVDQAGSRLLFRGYGVWDKQWPIHAALVANDALIILDEAHCSKPFAETLDAVRRYRTWSEQGLDTPFAFVEMTATPHTQGERFQLDDDDYRHATLRKRLFANKPARLVVSKARIKDFAKLAETLVQEALALAGEEKLARIAVMVNRVKTARLVYDSLKKKGHAAHLLIGRMRPVDRLSLPKEVERMLAGRPREDGEKTTFVVSTQCLEVGADLDFDALVTECASIDALQQRFGRVDRLGSLHDAGAAAQGRIVIASQMTDDKHPDPVYGAALARTWGWLETIPEVDFGLCSTDGGSTVRERLATAEDPNSLRRIPPPGPALLPVHLDLLAQTSPRPALDPDVALYLHGEQRGVPDVLVVWRADLKPYEQEQWAEVVALCPPVSLEAMPVPISEFRAWLAGSDFTGGSDVEGQGTAAEETPEDHLRCPVLRWRGDNSDLIDHPDKIAAIQPGDTLVLPAGAEGWNQLGHIPDDAPKDRAGEARAELRRAVLRLHPDLIASWPDTESKAGLSRVTGDPAAETAEVVAALREYGASLEADDLPWLKAAITDLPAPRRCDVEAYPQIGGTHVGWVVSTRGAEADSGQDESSSSEPVLLDRHLHDVARVARQFALGVGGLNGAAQTLIRAAEVHDYGKADPRFQALLHGGDPAAARFSPMLRAKGSAARQSPAARKAQWTRSGLPDHFRHELVSLLLLCADGGSEDELALHLVAAHHGRCRPFAPFIDDAGTDVAFRGHRARPQDWAQRPAHRLDSGIPDRFWRLTRRHGWWGLAYLEALLRLADWQASKEESQS